MSNENDQKPIILIDTYGRNPPAAAEFGKGITDQAGAQAAQDARRNAQPYSRQ